MSMRRRLAAGILLSFGAALPVHAQTPTFEQVTGHAFGERITVHHEMVSYLHALAAASPRVVVRNQGVTWEERQLPLAIVTSPENHARLDAIQANAQRLGDPRTLSAAEADAIVAGQPVVVWFGGSIHGFELSGAEGVLKLLEHLTTRDDAATLTVLRDAVILIDPMLNPDGRDAFAHLNHENLGRVPNAHTDDWTNDFTGWQSVKFRTSHYYFDINRDWFAHTQRETRAHVATFQGWRPQVAVDMHEMGPNSEFYFDPPAEPYGPFYPPYSQQRYPLFGAAYAQAFDSAGFEYMTRERYNFFYPGYSESYASYQGAIGMLYEQGSTRGLAITRGDGTVRTLADALEQQYVAAWTAARTAAANRDALLRDYVAAHRDAIADGATGTRRYLVTPRGDPGLIRELAGLLSRGGVEVDVLTQSVRLSGVRDRTGAEVGQRTFDVGTLVVEAAQPRNRLIRSLLEPDNPLEAEFLAAARRFVERDENPRFYDITAWSLPLSFDLDAYGTSDGRALSSTRWNAADVANPSFPAAPPGYAYLLDGANAASLAVLYHLKAEGHRAAVLWAPSRVGGHDVRGGTVVVRRGQNEPSVDEAVQRLAARYGVDVIGVETGLSEAGYPALGSGDFAFNVARPEIAIVAENPVAGYSFGWAWYTLDRQYEIPTTVLRVGSLGGDLSRFNVIVLPSVSGAALARTIGEPGLDRLRQWVRDGGTLVAIGGAIDFAREQLDMLALRSWYDTDDGKEAKRFDVPGAFFRAELDRGYWLSAGYDGGTLPVLVDSDRLYLPPEGPRTSRRRVVAWYDDEASGPMSGHAWPESVERMPGTVFVYEERVGSGRVIAFTEDVNYRAFWRGANRLFLNAVILGPSAP